jgi:hypothetical protein
MVLTDVSCEGKMADKDWRDDILEDLKREGYVAIESLGILTEKDIRIAMGAVRQDEATRDEAEEWNHIKELQRERADRLSGTSSK